MSEVKIECCANSVQSAINGQAGGAQRIELCANLEHGGTTPSAASICLAREALEIELYVLIRPRFGNFIYSDLELEEITEDIQFCKEIGCDGVAIGLLDKDSQVDQKKLKKLVQLARPMGVTFHRAFDVSSDIQKSLEDIIECGCDRLLTSGQASNAIEGIQSLKEIIGQADSRIEIMAGSGVNASNALSLYPIGIRQFHLSGSEIINHKEEPLGFGGNVSQTNSRKIQELADVLEGLA